MRYMYIFIIFFSMDKVWIDQCHDCGKRFANATKLNRHIKRVHGPRLKCNFCWWSSQSLVEHERAHHNRVGFVPAETPAFSGSVSSVIVSVTSSTSSSNTSTASVHTTDTNSTSCYIIDRGGSSTIHAGLC